MYDRATRLWTIENETYSYTHDHNYPRGFVAYKNNLLHLCGERIGLYAYNLNLTIIGNEHADGWSTNERYKRLIWETEGAFDWYGETGPMGLEEPGEKRIKSIQIRLKADAGTALRVQVQYDESGEWNEIAREIRGKRGTFRISYTPQRRCDTFRLRFEGKGDCIIYSIAIHAEDAGDSVG